MKEISDSEIRVIGQSGKRRFRPPSWLVWVVVVALAVAVVLVLLFNRSSRRAVSASVADAPMGQLTPVAPSNDAWLVVADTTVNDVPLTLFYPRNAHASLQIGLPSDSTVILAALAADIRADNGNFVGDFVIDGQQLARGERKEGYCAIVDGFITIGVTGGSDVLQRTIGRRGSFFRQYALVADGQAVPPKPKGKNHRRALCMLGDEVVLVASADRESYHDFATALADLGASQAIALVGSVSPLLYRPDGGLLHTIGESFDDPNANYIVWHK